MKRILLVLSFCLFANGAFAQGVVQNPNLFWATPLSGTGFLGLRVLGSNDFPAGIVGNAALANSSTTVNGVVCTLGSSCTATAAAGTLSGATLNAGVTASSLTTLGTLTSLGLSGAITDIQAIGATSTDGLLLDNATAATVGAQKWAPRVHWSGMGWKTNATAGSQSVDIIEELQPVQGAANPTGNLVWSRSVNGGAYGVLLTLPTGGGLNLNSGTYQIGGSQIAFTNIASSAACSQLPALTGQITTPAGSCATTLASGTVTNANLANPSTTVNGVTCTLGSTCTVSGNAGESGTSNPTSTASTSGVMMGMNGSITPTTTGNILVVSKGNVNNTVASDGCTITLRTGTGTAPTNGAALTGTTLVATFMNNPAAAGATGSYPWALDGVLTGKALGVTMWVDIGLTAVTGGTCAVQNVQIGDMEQ